MVILIVKLREGVRGVKDVEHVSSVSEKDRDVDVGVSALPCLAVLCRALLCCAELSCALSCCAEMFLAAELLLSCC
jgi:hypothetical protein